jgi:hypothetical protein
MTAKALGSFFEKHRSSFLNKALEAHLLIAISAPWAGWPRPAQS